MKKRKKMIEIGPDLAQFEGEPKDSEGLCMILLRSKVTVAYFT